MNASVKSLLVMFLGAILVMSLIVESSPIPDPVPAPAPIWPIVIRGVALAAPKIIKALSRKNNKGAWQNGRPRGTTGRKVAARVNLARRAAIFFKIRFSENILDWR
ncbi:hypothetical protein Anas_12033 [Armadillidium nasatum]|uniref:Uncharacterized protein n=1 Tax=Armadillidium nasatum TaxID=96803 RepID=A0A5N5T6G8_9CRUS|nr:hypothetical protein Anas_12033 [Armadillidium nasatum]